MYTRTNYPSFLPLQSHHYSTTTLDVSRNTQLTGILPLLYHLKYIYPKFIAQITMEVCEQAQVFTEDYQFDHSKIILRNADNEYFYAKTNVRINLSSKMSQTDVNQLDIIPIPAHHIWPLADPTFTRAPEPLPSPCYVKRPNLIHYDAASNDEHYGHIILTEVEACEALRLHPHPNVAQYMGCIVNDGRIKGLCFPKYRTTLAQLLKDGTAFDKSRFLREIEAGVRHMHDVGLVHNDVNPANIMTDGEGGAAVLIDFDSCKKEGDKLGAKAGTEEWTRDEGEYARRENDWYSVSLIAAALGIERNELEAEIV